MNHTPERLALHEALHDMQLRGLSVDDYDQLTKADRRLLDQFAYRYTRLQDDMGARLAPAVLNALGEDVAPMSALTTRTHPQSVLNGCKLPFRLLASY